MQGTNAFETYVLSINALGDRGGWDAVFGRRARLELEIGFGWDPFLLELAADHPETDFVGMEYDGKRVETFARRASEMGLPNVRAVFGEAFYCLPRMFSPGRIDRVYVHFPDPWHKKRQQKNRLLGPEFLKLLFHHCTPHGQLVVGTDSEDYAGFIQESLESVRGLCNLLAPLPFVDALPGHPTTRFERLFRSQGKPIHYFHYARGDRFAECYAAEVEALRARIPQRTDDMPHAIFDRTPDIETFARTFEPREWREGEVVFKLRDVWFSPQSRGLLLEALIVQEGHDELFYFEVSPKGPGAVLRVAPLREVERNTLLFHFLAHVARLFQERFPGLRVERHNLGRHTPFPL